MSKRIMLLSFLTVALSINSFAQEQKKKPELSEFADPVAIDPGIEAPNPGIYAPQKEDVIFTSVEQAPAFPGGTEVMQAFIQKHKKYPQKAPDSDIEGRVFVGFIVKSDGRIENIEIKRSLSPSHDAAAIRVIKMMPKWVPAKQNGRAVDCRYTLPIDFYFLN